MKKVIDKKFPRLVSVSDTSSADSVQGSSAREEKPNDIFEKLRAKGARFIDKPDT